MANVLDKKQSMTLSFSFRNLLFCLFTLSFLATNSPVSAQMLRIPDGVNIHKSASQKIGVTEVEVTWNAPSVRGREGNIWGTDVAYFGFKELGFGSYVPSPWRAGSNECTTISFTTDVTINGKPLAAGKYAFFIALEQDSSTLIFNKNVGEWGSYFYDKDQDVLRVVTRQRKDQPLQEILKYDFIQRAENELELYLAWENWQIPMSIGVDLKKTTLASIQSQMSGAMGFDPLSLEAAARWCLTQEVNYQQALTWIESATDPKFTAIDKFGAITVKAGLLEKLGRDQEAEQILHASIHKANTFELHNYGRQLLAQNKVDKALEIFEFNFKNQAGQWPTHVGLMRGLSAKGKLKEALDHARLALEQAPNDMNRNVLKEAITKLEKNQAL
ncbi:MAG: DUF2911 domain-containing protein [Saprospiraceae bacterium]|nr:DUF2911 domain-containing protein [Saprospiraceae bacterium]